MNGSSRWFEIDREIFAEIVKKHLGFHIRHILILVMNKLLQGLNFYRVRDAVTLIMAM